MDTAYSDLQEDLRENVERFFAKECPLDRVRAAEPLGHDATLWKEVVELGLPDLGVPEESGGPGGSLVDLVIVASACGRALAPVPLIESAVTARLLSRCPGPVGHDQDRLTTFVPRRVVGDQIRAVPAGAVADAAIVYDGATLRLVEPGGAAPRPSPANLGSMPLSDWTLTAAAPVLAEGAVAEELYRTAALEWRLLTAAALVGLGEHAMDIALGYVSQRRAFGTLIGSFQGVAHPLADDTVALDGARLLCLEAAWSLDRQTAGGPYYTRMAYYHAVESARRAAADALHVHGGIGFTLEAAPQLFYRRAKAWPLVCGDPERELDAIADHLIRTSLEDS